ncbi:TPA: DUF2971 domain-containing protein [Vibrio vulnificus]|uniref:DUF2971 domain-containing protein n=1 Tax=Vibrio vulnificus TaxID=672 RepID=UPI001FAF6220|nr:DUF2971 domain-containing protein [Vibrio vulnificus]MCJ0806860.1 DUF2971 domain-containing protein [Vibrio vulnificus]HDY7526506.1 DUF2971 domain-containing protein [Vibrio vulnificus]HDY7531123.1 DUF2971 domain-containing protein [Vibrio vulnificus]
MKLYKYRSTSKYSLEGLINNELFFATHEQFNDPFEFGNPAADLVQYNKNARVKLRELFDQNQLSRKDFLYLNSLVAKPSEETLIEREKTLSRIREDIKKIGVVCLSEVENNILMWSHYGEEHRGFCIEFYDLENHISSPCDVIDVNYIDQFEDFNDPELLIDFYMIMFCDNKHLPQREWEAKYKELGGQVSKYEESLLAKATIGNKYTDWAYEKEVRLVSKINGPIKYDPRAIKSITFGLRMSESDKRTIMNICDCDNKRHINFKQAIRQESSYGLKILDVK